MTGAISSFSPQCINAADAADAANANLSAAAQTAQDSPTTSNFVNLSVAAHEVELAAGQVDIDCFPPAQNPSLLLR